MRTLDLDAIDGRAATTQDRAAVARKIIAALAADHHRHVAIAASPLIATMNRIEAIDAAD